MLTQMLQDTELWSVLEVSRYTEINCLQWPGHMARKTLILCCLGPHLD